VITDRSPRAAHSGGATQHRRRDRNVLDRAAEIPRRVCCASTPGGRFPASDTLLRDRGLEDRAKKPVVAT
jgi:hypothetical protein